MSKSEGEERIFSFTDIRKTINEPFICNAQYCAHYFNSRFLFEMCYEALTGDGLKEGPIIFKKYDLHSPKLISENSIVVKCKSCFHLPKLLSENLIVASHYGMSEHPTNELILFNNTSSKRFELIPPIIIEGLVDVNNADLMNLGFFLFNLDKDHKKLYSLATTETEVVVMEYALSEVR
jgi:hypothetical protein